MVCVLATPQWDNPAQVGLRSAIENVADNTMVLNWYPAHATSPASTFYYLIYNSADANTLYDNPKYISLETTVAIPQTLVSSSDYFAVRVAQLGVTSIFNTTNLSSVFTDGYTFAASTELSATFAPADGYIFVDTINGYPIQDGYLSIGTEIIQYANSVTSFMGSPAFYINNRDPYGCNDAYGGTYPVGTIVSLHRGFENRMGSRVAGLHSCGLQRPTWVDSRFPGIQKVKDLGIGTTVEVSWNYAKAPAGFSNLYYNVYADTNLYNLGAGQPFGLSDQLSAVVPGLHPGDGYHFAVRAAYSFKALDVDSMTQLSDGFYAYPTNTVVNELDGYYSIGETTPLRVNSTDGFPSSGMLRIGSEILEYTGITPATFIISRRDVFEFDLVIDYIDGTAIELFKGIEDGNTVVYMSTPTWTARSAWLPPIPGDGYDGYLYMQDADGYRSTPINNITEDHEEFEENNIDFATQDYCGFRAQDFTKLYSRNQCGTYLGGRIGGFGGGIDVFEANIQREEMLLGLTGEPFMLLQRKWTGKACPKLSLRDEHPHQRCHSCYGTMFDGGFDRYLNPREIQPGEPNTNGFIFCRVSPYTDDLGIFDDRGLSTEVVEIDIWTIAIPFIKDRDILIRYVYDIEFGVVREEFRYEVLSVNRNKMLFGKDGAQKIRIKRLNRTDEIYKYRVPLV